MISWASLNGTQLATQCTKAFGEQAFDEGVYVFVGRDGLNLARSEVVIDRLEGGDDAACLVRIQQSGPLKLVGVGLGTCDVIGVMRKYTLGDRDRSAIAGPRPDLSRPPHRRSVASDISHFPRIGRLLASQTSKDARK